MKMEAEGGFCFREKRRAPVQPASYEGLLFPKRRAKKEERGAGEVGRKRSSVSGLRMLGNREARGKCVGLREGCSEIRADSDAKVGNCLDDSAQVSQKLRRLKQLRFEGECECLDISDDGVSDGLVETESCYERDIDEYILV